ncbi:MAG: type IV toxin-antitoxin system AbiEi family antitoxin domain-containing protein [Planctomycetota bacterium]|nr:type IV toxin-antitoxin system AbiEi family antitoxin domain-containing protein [Planctomycetota bacterium]
MESTHQAILDLARKQGLFRPRDLVPLGISRMTLMLLVQRGEIVRFGRGLYGLPDAPNSAHTALAEAARRVPSGVVCLLSALRDKGRKT